MDNFIQSWGEENQIFRQIARNRRHFWCSFEITVILENDDLPYAFAIVGVVGGSAV